MPEFAIREEYIKPYLNAFQNSSFLIRYPLVDAEKYGFGLYNDMTGDYDETVYWLEQMKPGIWEQTNLEEQADTKDVWKKYPIGGEFASSYENSHFLLTNFDLTLEGIKDSLERVEDNMNDVTCRVGNNSFICVTGNVSTQGY